MSPPSPRPSYCGAGGDPARASRTGRAWRGGHPPAGVEPVDLGLHAANGIGVGQLGGPFRATATGCSDGGIQRQATGLAARARALASRRARCWSSAPAGSGRTRVARPQGRRRSSPSGVAGRADRSSSRRPRPTGRACASASPTLLDGSYEELWIETWPGSPSGCCASTRSRPGSTRSSSVAGPADRLAMLLDRLDELPLRRHEIRGNPAGLLARLLRRIDVLKAEGIGPADAARSARGPPSAGAGGAAEREVALARDRVRRALRPPRRDPARGRDARRARAGARARPRADPAPRRRRGARRALPLA